MRASNGNEDLMTTKQSGRGCVRVLVMAAVMTVASAALQAGAETITWTNTAGGNWDTSSLNWTNSAGVSTNFTDDGTVDAIFNKTNGGTITISPNMSPASVTVSAASGTYTFSNGAIDSGTLTKSGGGILSILETCLNTFTGRTVIAGGQLTFATNVYAGVAGPLGAPTGADATVDMYPGTTLQCYPPDVPNRNKYVYFDRTINLAGTGSGTITLKNRSNNHWASFTNITGTGTGPRTLQLSPNGDNGRISINGAISDTSDDKVSLSVTFTSQSGTGNTRLDLNGTNTFSGPIATTGGSGKTYFFNIYGSGSLGNGAYTNTILINTGVILDYGSSRTQVLSGAISGAGTFKASGPGVVKLTGSSNSVGNVTLASNGTLQVGPRSGSAVLNVAGSIDVASGVTNSTLALDITGGEVRVNVTNSLVYAGTHTTYLKIIGGGQATPVITYGGTMTNFDYVVYNGSTSTWADAQVTGALRGHGGPTQLRIDGNNVYIDPLPPSGTVLIIK